MAVVYEARRESLAGVSPRVAIKLILPEHENSEAYRELFVNEARLGSVMEHQNLVQIQDFEQDGERLFLVMEYVEGLTLRRIISLCQQYDVAVPVAVVAEIGRQAADGLHYAHQVRDEQGRHLQLVHRDMKPSNLILTPHAVVKVLDFGISKGHLRKEREGAIKGTWGYMAPEQAAGVDVMPVADVFGLATVLYEMAARRPLFQDKSKDEIRRLLADDHAARMAATLDPAFAPLVGPLVRALQRDPLARHGTAEEFGRALAAVLPDPVTTRDELVRFHDRMVVFHEGRGGRKGDAATERGIDGSLAASTGTSAMSGWLVSGVLALVALALVVLGFAGYAWFGQGSAAEHARGLYEAELPTEAEAVEVSPAVSPPTPPPPVRVKVVRDLPLPVEGAPEAPDSLPTPRSPVGEIPADQTFQRPVDATASIFVDAKQPAEVYIAGQFVQMAPVKRDLPPGRYAISLVALDGRRRTFEVELLDKQHLRKVWDFDRGAWR